MATRQTYNDTLHIQCSRRVADYVSWPIPRLLVPNFAKLPGCSCALVPEGYSFNHRLSPLALVRPREDLRTGSCSRLTG